MPALPSDQCAVAAAVQLSIRRLTTSVAMQLLRPMPGTRSVRKIHRMRVMPGESQMNNDWSLRLPTHAEPRAAFGSLRIAREKTGGDHVTACFLIANPDKIPMARKLRKVEGQWSDELDEAAQVEIEAAKAAREQKRIDDAIAAYREHGTIAAAMRAGKFGAKRAKEICRQVAFLPPSAVL